MGDKWLEINKMKNFNEGMSSVSSHCLPSPRVKQVSTLAIIRPNP
jgi:hypothetical protein